MSIGEKFAKKKWSGLVEKRLKDTAKFLLRFIKRKPKFFFHSPKFTVLKAGSNKHLHNLFPVDISETKNKLVDGLSVYKDVISYPLDVGKEKNHSGGLIDSSTNQLIKEAIHFNGELCQELPDLDDNFFTKTDLPEIQNPVLFGGIMYNNYGHFLLESISRLWAYQYVKQFDPYILFYTYWGNPYYLNTKNYVYQALSGLNIPHEKVFFLEYAARIKTVFVPVQKYGYGFSKRPDELFMTFINSFKFPYSIPENYKNAKKIYVSRSKLPIGYGKPIGENLFEEYLISNGYAIFYPERYTLFQQLSVYAHAEKLIFCDGASIHTCILLPKLKAQVAIIARRVDERWPSIDITHQFEGYDQKVLWVDAVEGQYQFGLETWYACAVIDWYTVSNILHSGGFVDAPFSAFREINYEAIVRREVSRFIKAISKKPQFMDFMIKSKN